MFSGHKALAAVMQLELQIQEKLVPQELPEAILEVVETK